MNTEQMNSINVNIPIEATDIKLTRIGGLYDIDYKIGESWHYKPVKDVNGKTVVISSISIENGYKVVTLSPPPTN